MKAISAGQDQTLSLAQPAQIWLGENIRDLQDLWLIRQGSKGGHCYAFTHPSVIKTTFLLYLLYFATPAGMTAPCGVTDAVSIIGRWKPFV